jgi:hypothetical protein
MVFLILAAFVNPLFQMNFRSYSFLLLLALCLTQLHAASDLKVQLNRDVRPILSDTCFHRHAPDEKERKGGLRLDVRDEAMEPAKSGARAIVSGKPSTL